MASPPTKSVQPVTAGTQVPHDAAHGAPSNFPPFDATTFAPQLIWLALTFGFLYLFLSRVALPPIADMIAARDGRIKADLEEAERLKTETDQAIASYEQALADAKAKGNAIATETRNKLNAEVDKERASVEAVLAKKTADAEKRIGDTKAKALGGIADIAADTAGAIFTKLTGKDVSIADVKKVLASSGSK
jgi:F-type H+-transporting ATPase subunit b